MPEYFTNYVLKITAEYDLFGVLSWAFDENDDVPTFIINCNDVFYWGASDAEELTEENFYILEESLSECEDYGTELFCARVRGMRPQGAYYPKNKKVQDLFNSCGPERSIDCFNPAKPVDL